VEAKVDELEQHRKLSQSLDNSKAEPSESVPGKDTDAPDSSKVEAEIYELERDRKFSQSLDNSKAELSDSLPSQEVQLKKSRFSDTQIVAVSFPVKRTV
jgi:hypothetical protein